MNWGRLKYESKHLKWHLFTPSTPTNRRVYSASCVHVEMHTEGITMWLMRNFQLFYEGFCKCKHSSHPVGEFVERIMRRWKGLSSKKFCHLPIYLCVCVEAGEGSKVGLNFAVQCNCWFLIFAHAAHAHAHCCQLIHSIVSSKVWLMWRCFVAGSSGATERMVLCMHHNSLNCINCCGFRANGNSVASSNNKLPCFSIILLAHSLRIKYCVYIYAIVPLKGIMEVH